MNIAGVLKSWLEVDDNGSRRSIFFGIGRRSKQFCERFRVVGHCAGRKARRNSSQMCRQLQATTLVVARDRMQLARLTTSLDTVLGTISRSVKYEVSGHLAGVQVTGYELGRGRWEWRAYKGFQGREGGFVGVEIKKGILIEIGECMFRNGTK